MRNETIFDGSKDGKNDSKGKRPILKNNEGCAAWLHTDKNGNVYLSVKAGPFGSFQLFANDPKNGEDKIEGAMNQLGRYLKQ